MAKSSLLLKAYVDKQLAPTAAFKKIYDKAVQSAKRVERIKNKQ